MQKHRLQRSALLALCLLLTLMTGAVGLWVRQEQRQYALNRKLINALVRSDNRQALLLVNRGADPNTPYDPPTAPTLKQLLHRLFHPAPADNNCSTAFSVACGGSWKDEFGLYNLNMTHTIEQADTMQQVPLVQAMLKHNAHLNGQYDRFGFTPLMVASQTAAPDIVLLLLEHGADVNAQDQNGRTALYLAVCMNANYMYPEDPIPQLLAYGANPNLPTKDGYTAIKAAEGLNHPYLAALLTKAPSNSSALKQTTHPMSEP